MFLYNIHFCLIWKSQNVSFSQAITELKANFKTVDKYMTEEKLSSNFKYEFKPKKIESHLPNFIVYDLETHNTERARPYNMIFYRISKLAGKYDRKNLTPYEIEKCKKDTLVFRDDDCITKTFDFSIKLKGQPRKTINNKSVENNLQLHAHNGYGFDNWVIINTLPCDKHMVDIIRNGKGIIC